MKISVASKVLRSYHGKSGSQSFKNELQTMLCRIKQCGYDGIEMGTPKDLSNSEFKEYLDAADLAAITITCCDYGVLEGSSFSELIEQCRILGAGNVMIPNLPRVALGNQYELDRFIGNLNRVGKILIEESGVKLSYHNHAIDFSKVGGVTIMDQIVDKTDERYVFFEPDTHWLQAGGAHVVSWLKKLKGRIAVVHFMDYAIDQYSDHSFLECTHKLFAEIGMGNLNWPGIIAECKEQGIEHCAVEQNVVFRPPYEAIALSCTNLRAYGA